jgi:hypothetical protein
MLHPDILELHVEPALEHVSQREPFIVPVQLFHVRPFRLDAHHLGGELAAGKIADAQVANEDTGRRGLELSFVAVTYIRVGHDRIPPIGAGMDLTRLRRGGHSSD